MKKIVLVLLLSLSTLLAIEIGKVPLEVIIDGKDGGNVKGTSWSSSMIQEKVTILFYVDPDEKSLNEELSHALKEKEFDRDSFKSIAIVNLKATWLPNMIIEKLLKSKQKEFPYTTYVKDKNKILVKKWKLADDNSDILLFNKKGELIYKKFGKVSKKEIKKVIQLIEENL